MNYIEDKLRERSELITWNKLQYFKSIFNHEICQNKNRTSYFTRISQTAFRDWKTAADF